MNKKLTKKEQAYRNIIRDLKQEHIKPLITIKNEKVY